MTSQALLTGTSEWWQVRDSNPRSTKRLIYSQIHLAALVTCRAPLSRCRERIALKWLRAPIGTTIGGIPTKGAPMADSSFDVVSKLDRQDLDNAVNQTAKEIANRYDFRGVDAAITLSGDTIAMEANSASRVMAILDVLQSKLIRRGLSLKVLDYKDREPKASGKLFKLACPLKEGIPQDTAKKISKLIREEGPKGVKAQIQGDELRVSSKSRDDLQAVIALLKGPKGEELDVALQFVNYR